MPLTCGIQLDHRTRQAGSTAQAWLVVSNPDATSTVVVTGAQLTARPLAASQPSPTLPCNLPLVPLVPQQIAIGPGASQTFGPMAINFSWPDNQSSTYATPPAGSAPIADITPSSPPQLVVQIGATVWGSDGSINTASPMGLTISYLPAPTLGTQGGFFNFADGNNFLNGLMLGVL